MIIKRKKSQVFLFVLYELFMIELVFRESTHFTTERADSGNYHIITNNSVKSEI